MPKPPPAVVWIGRATPPALAVACSTCNAAIGQPCTTWLRGEAVTCPPHRAREEYAEVLGFRAAVRHGDLFELAGLP